MKPAILAIIALTLQKLVSTVARLGEDLVIGPLKFSEYLLKVIDPGVVDGT